MNSLIVTVFAVLFTSGEVIANSRTLEPIRDCFGGALPGTVFQLIGDLTVLGITAELQNIDKLTGAISREFSNLISIAMSIPSLVPDLAIAAQIENVGSSVIELAQTVNVVAETAASVNQFDEIIAIVNGISASLSDAVCKLLETIISAVVLLATYLTTDAAEAIASIQLVLQSILKIVAEVLDSLQGLLSNITNAASSVLTAALNAINHTLSGVDEIVNQLSNNPLTAFTGNVSSLKEIAVQLSSSVSEIVTSSNAALADALKNISPPVGISSGAISPVLSLHIDDALKDILSDVAASLLGVSSNIEAAVNSIAASLPSVIGVVDSAISVVFNVFGEILLLSSSITADDCKSAASVNGLADRINDAVNKLIAAVQGVVTSILFIANGDMTAELTSVFEKIVCAVVTLAQCVVSVVAGLVDDIVASFVDIANKLSEIISGLFNNLFSCINGNSLDKILNGLSNSVSALAGNLTSSLSAITLPTVLKSSFGVSGYLYGSLNGFTAVFCSILNGTTGKVSSVIQQVAVDGVVVGAAAALSLSAVNVNANLQTLTAILSTAARIGFLD